MITFIAVDDPTIRIYTDGSCHTQLLTGAWAAIIFYDQEKIILKGTEENTTHNRMEIIAVINSLNWIKDRQLDSNTIQVYSDSQYVVDLPKREARLSEKNFMTKAGNDIQNSDLVKTFLRLIKVYKLEFIKIKAHQKDGDVFNREVDLLVRDLLRKEILK